MNILDQDHRWLQDELRNFEEIARFLKPSSGEIPRLEGIDIAGCSMPLGEKLGGDHVLYIDFKRRYELNMRIEQARRDDRPDLAAKLEGLRRKAGILVADVSGHRMTDALIAAMLHQAFLLGVHYELDLFGEITTRIFEHINTRFYRSTAINKYFTMIYGEISEGGLFRFLSAGHHPPAVFSREFGCFVTISPERLVSFPPVGMLPSGADPDDREPDSLDRFKKSYAVNEIDLLSVGDLLLLYTDGLSDHADGRCFPHGVERLIADAGDASATEICARIRRHLLDSGEPQDDISYVVIRRTS